MKKNQRSVKNMLTFSSILVGLNLANAQCPVPSLVTASPSTLCAGATTSLNATAIGSSINWYTVPSGGTSIGTSPSGVNFPITPVNTTTYYAESFEVGAVTTNSYNYTGNAQSFTIPNGVTSITVNARGAQGGSGGGLGGRVTCVFPVTPGAVLNIYVGGQGAPQGSGALGGYNGGGNAGICNVNFPGSGGGGASDIRIGGVALANRVIVAGGGGGSHAINNNPGAGGGLTGGNVGPTGNGCIATYATGGTQMAGGNSCTSSGVCCTFVAAAPAGLGIGGTGAGPSPNCNNGDGGAGGGGGYYGGGGGGTYSAGGGGSSYTDPAATNVVHTQGNQSGNGQIVISYNLPGCVSVSRTPVTVTVNPIPVVTASSGSICSGQSFTISPNGANTYTYQGGNAVVNPTVTTTYSVAGTSTAGCVSNSIAVTVSVNAIPTIAVNNGTICAGQAFTMIPTGANSYTFQGGNAIVNPTVNTSYTVVGTSSAGCVSNTFATSNVVVNTTPTVAITGNTLICGTGTNVLTTGGANTYSWNTGAVTPTISVSPTITTSYSVVVTNTLGNCTNTFVSTVVVSSNPTVSITGGTVAVCKGTTVNLTAGGATTYSWSTGVTTSSIAPTPTTSTSYSVVGTNTAGCTNTAVVSVTILATPTVVVLGSPTLCLGRSTTYSVSGANTYSWSTGETTTSISVSPTVNTNYTVVGTNTVTGCTGTFTFALTVDPCTGLNSYSSSNTGLFVYPNPTAGDFIVEMKAGTEKTVQVTDILGKVVLKKIFSGEKMNLNIEQLPAGTYYVKVQTENSIETVKILKQ